MSNSKKKNVLALLDICDEILVGEFHEGCTCEDYKPACTTCRFCRLEQAVEAVKTDGEPSNET